MLFSTAIIEHVEVSRFKLCLSPRLTRSTIPATSVIHITVFFENEYYAAPQVTPLTICLKSKLRY